MTVTRPQISLPGAFRRPPRPRLSRRASGFVGGLAVFIGLVLLFDAVITVVWEDPFTTVFTQREQKALSKKLATAEEAPLPASTLELVRRAGSEAERMAVLAAHERVTARAGDPLGRIFIPKTGKNFVFISGTGVETLKKGPGHYSDTALPGERGTVAIAGHRTTYAAPFRRLSKLRRGYAITMTMPYGKFTYSVEGSRSVPPTQTTVLGNAHYDRLVLTTCTPLGSADKRLVVTARLRTATPRGAAIKLVPVAPRAPDWTAPGNASRSG
jgi:sortase A